MILRQLDEDCQEDEEGKNEPISRLFAREILYCRRWNWKAWENQVEEYRAAGGTF